MPAAPLRPAAIDLATDPRPAAALHAALVTHGFAAVRNTAVSDALREQAFLSARAFFARPTVIKARDTYKSTQANFGYQGLMSEALDPAQMADLKEAFTMRNLSYHSQHSETAEKSNSATPEDRDSWAATEFGATATRLYAACSTTALHLLALIAQALNTPTDTFARCHTGENMTLRYLRYPAQAAGAARNARPGAAPSNGSKTDLSTGPMHKDDANSPMSAKKVPQLGAGAHTDYGTITLLFSDGVAGLQLYDISGGASKGRWRDVEVAPGDVLVNTGDLMSLWSNGRYPSTLHRVQPRLSKPDRYSMAFFVDPDSSTRVSPLPCCIDSESSDAPPISASAVVAGEHIQARIEASQRTLA